MTSKNPRLGFHLYLHFEKYRDFIKFSGVEILWKGTVSAQFEAIRPKLCGNCALPQNFHTTKLGKTTVFLAVIQHNFGMLVLNPFHHVTGLYQYPLKTSETETL